MKKEIIEILKDLLSFKTVDGNEEEFFKIFEYIKSFKKQELFYKEYEFKGKKACVISNDEGYEFDYIFSTHIDVVPATSYETHEDEMNLYGRGTIDMKCGVAVLLKLFNDIKTDKKIALFITSDEEIDGNCTYELLSLYKAKLGIVPDGGTNFNLIQEEKGLLRLKLSIQTVSAHSSQPFNGVNAITELFKVYERIIEKYPLPKNENEYITSVNLAKFQGGDALNQVASNAEMYLDIRHIAKDTKEEIISFIKGIHKEIDVEVLLTGDVFKTDLSNKEIQRYIQVCEKVLGRKVKIVGCESTSDAIYFSNLNIPTIIMNPNGYYAHCPNEYVNKESLCDLYKIYKEFIEGDQNGK